jgi:outer membrane protein OmpA-like peptidoglycan-associated protein
MTFDTFIRYGIAVLFGLGLIFTASGQQKPGKTEALVDVILTDGNNLPERDAQVFFHGSDNDLKKSFTTDSAGKGSVILPQGKTFDVKVKKYNTTFDFSRPLKIPQAEGPMKFKYEMSLILDTVYEETYTLENVYFDLDKATLKPESHDQLDKLARTMKQNKNMVIEIAGHTDSQGSKEYNLRLSQKRAETVRQYLINKGISPDRVTPKGYGEAQPIGDNDTKEGRAKNRRTEVRVIQK